MSACYFLNGKQLHTPMVLNHLRVNKHLSDFSLSVILTRTSHTLHTHHCGGRPNGGHRSHEGVPPGAPQGDPLGVSPLPDLSLITHQQTPL